jgi:hypothetical protein
LQLQPSIITRSLRGHPLANLPLAGKENSVRRNLKLPNPERTPVRGAIQISLSGSKLVSASGWIDVTDKAGLLIAIHEIVADNIALEKRPEMLERLVAEKESETNQIEEEITECEEMIEDLLWVVGEKGVGPE